MTEPTAQPPAYEAPSPYGAAPQGFGQVAAVSGGTPATQGGGTGTIGIRRNAWVQWIMMIIPIYNLVHICSVAEQLKRFDSRNKGSGVASFFSYIPGAYLFAIPPIVLTVRTAGRIRQAQRAAGLQEDCSTGLSVLLLIVFGLNWWYWQDKMNGVWDRYPGAATGSQVPLSA